jgi:hypothetical protein
MMPQQRGTWRCSDIAQFRSQDIVPVRSDPDGIRVASSARALCIEQLYGLLK